MALLQKALLRSGLGWGRHGDKGQLHLGQLDSFVEIDSLFGKVEMSLPTNLILMYEFAEC